MYGNLIGTFSIRENYKHLSEQKQYAQKGDFYE